MKFGIGAGGPRAGGTRGSLEVMAMVGFQHLSIHIPHPSRDVNPARLKMIVGDGVTEGSGWKSLEATSSIQQTSFDTHQLAYDIVLGGQCSSPWRGNMDC